MYTTLATTPLYAQGTTDVQIAHEYYNKGDKENARRAYQELARRPEHLPAIYANYLNLLLDAAQYKQAEDLVERMARRDDRLSVKADAGIVYLRSGNVTKADKYFKDLIRAQGQEAYRLKSLADYFAAQNLPDYAVASLTYAREATGNGTLFILEMANLYRLQNKRDQMVDEYLRYVTQAPNNTNYVKNLLQVLLTKPEEFESLERLLLDRVQQNPNVEVYADLLIWTNLQQKNFYGAFIQARAYDKRFKRQRPKTLEIAQVALNNNDYENAERGFLFVSKEYARTELDQEARLGLIRAREAKLKRRYPVNQDSLRLLAAEYQDYIQRFPDNPFTHDAQIDEARLHAQYLGARDTAIVRLQKLIGNPRVAPLTKAKAKLDLGNIYILKNEPWEATLLFAQVEKQQRETVLGYEAKLRNAQLSYYKGEFKLALEHLDILKQATTREIANDAMDLALRIKENTGYDTLGFSLKQYARIELLLYQNEVAQAVSELEYFKSGKVLMKQAEAFLYDLIDRQTLLNTEGEYVWVTLPPAYQNRAIADDVYWLEANLRQQQGQYQRSAELFQKIVDEFPDDVLTDDAYFRLGQVYEEHLRDKPKAMEVYRTFLDKFPGSVYAAEARKRFRQLRGDFDEGKNN
ncbi:MAG: tetratricopeptide repeat protein [Cyclobacteriaceae bacterium]|nr:tetratricopeptide repeat protein [Cyclobacteriaceae bacterium]